MLATGVMETAPPPSDSGLPHRSTRDPRLNTDQPITRPAIPRCKPTERSSAPPSDSRSSRMSTCPGIVLLPRTVRLILRLRDQPHVELRFTQRRNNLRHHVPHRFLVRTHVHRVHSRVLCAHFLTD